MDRFPNEAPQIVGRNNLAGLRINYCELRWADMDFAIICNNCGHPDGRDPCEHEILLRSYYKTDDE